VSGTYTPAGVNSATVTALAGAPGFVIYSTTVAAGGNVYGTFASALAAAKLTHAPWILWQGAGEILPGAYDMTTAGMNWAPFDDQPTFISIDAGVTLTGWRSADELYISCANSAPVMTLNDGGFHLLSLRNNATIDTSLGTAEFFAFTNSTSATIDLLDGASFVPGTGGVLSAASGTSPTVTMGNNISVPNNTVKGAGAIAISLYGGGIMLGSTQTGASALTVTDYRRSAEALCWSASALAATTATASTMPPGYGTTTIAGAYSSTGIGIQTPSTLLAPLTNFSAKIVGNAANVLGQTMTFTLYKNGSQIAQITGIATTASGHSGSVTFSPVARTTLDIFASEALPSAGLTASPTGILLSAG
jgi:hypothetical protein